MAHWPSILVLSFKVQNVNVHKFVQRTLALHSALASSKTVLSKAIQARDDINQKLDRSYNFSYMKPDFY